MRYIMAADTGGTFTDLAAYDSLQERVVYTKSLTTYGDLVHGVMDCVAKADIDLAQTDTVKFGTTLVINTYIQRNGARTALVGTRGFRDVLEIARGNRPVPFDLRFKRESPLIERTLRLGVEERIGADGEVLTPLNMQQVEELAAILRGLDVESVAVSFLNSYANDEHERAAVERLRELLPDVYVSAGVELSGEWYEYERTSTVAANAYVGPKLKDYVSRLQMRLGQQGFHRSFFLMASNGGVFSAQRAQECPVMLVESGPVGGCIGAGVYAEALDIGKAIAFDMGGTTAKCALLENGRFEVKSPYYVGGYERGFPIRGGVLDIVEVGAGGGSIAWCDKFGGLHVGPQSAGSTPGPVCYGKGGTEPTITDANLVLGRIAPSSFLGGQMSLDVHAAHNAIARLASSLGFEGPGAIDETAQGILDLGDVTMASAIKQITVERGVDPRGLTMFAFGGGGPLHTAALARELNIPHLIIPAEPGNFSAVGMLLAKARVDEAITFLNPLDDDRLDAANAAFAEMGARMREDMAADLGAEEVQLERQAMLSFVGQKHSLQIPLPIGASADEVRAGFEDAYRRRYGHAEEGAPVQLTSLIMTGTAQMRSPDLKGLSPAPRDKVPLDVISRSVFFAARKSRLDTSVYQRRQLPVGFGAAGPAIIEEYGSTTVVGPDDRFEIGDLGEIHIYFHIDESVN